MIHIATDGSARPTNPGPCGWGWVDEHGHFEGHGIPYGTNNIGELCAIRDAILAHPGQDIKIQYDSQYAKRCITEWGPAWKAKGTTGKANQELIYSIMDILERHQGQVHWEWIRGHGDHHLNICVDKVAALMSTDVKKAGKDIHHTGHIDTKTFKITQQS